MKVLSFRPNPRNQSKSEPLAASPWLLFLSAVLLTSFLPLHAQQSDKSLLTQEKLLTDVLPNSDFFENALIEGNVSLTTDPLGGEGEVIRLKADGNRADIRLGFFSGAGDPGFQVSFEFSQDGMGYFPTAITGSGSETSTLSFSFRPMGTTHVALRNREQDSQSVPIAEITSGVWTEVNIAFDMPNQKIQLKSPATTLAPLELPPDLISPERLIFSLISNQGGEVLIRNLKITPLE